MDDIPAGFKRIQGSMRRPARGASLVGSANPDESVTATFYLRRNPDAPPLLNMEYWANTPPRKRKFLCRKEFASQYGAAQADIDEVTKFATTNDLKVEETSVAKCSVRVSGAVKQMRVPFALAFRSPARTRSAMKLRPDSATASRTVNIITACRGARVDLFVETV
jgi:kumamolisin